MSNTNGPSGPNRKSPIDPVVGELIRSAVDDQRGFVLGIADRMREDGREELAIRVDQTIAPHDEYEGPVKWRNHNVEDVASLIAIATKYSNADRGLVLYNDQGATLCLDETKERGSRELISLKFRHSPEFDAWRRLLAQPQQHKPMLDAMLLLQHTLADPTILVAMRKVKLTWEANHESDLRVDGDTVGVQFKSKAGTELVDFPRSWNVHLPILDQDLLDESGWTVVGMKLEVEMPTRPDVPVAFKLFSPKLGIAVRERIDREIAIVREALQGWTIARGSHLQLERIVGT